MAKLTRLDFLCCHEFENDLKERTYNGFKNVGSFSE